VVAVSFLVIALGGTFGLTCVDFNHSPIENHRWVTLPLLLAPLLGAFMLAEPAAFGASRRVAGPAAWFVYISCGLGAATTIDWLLGGAGKDLMGTQFLGHHPKYDLNCRKVTGAHWFEPTTPTYIEDRGVYLWAGCHPTFVAGPIEDIDKHHIKTGGAISGRPALQDTLKNMVGPDTPIFVVCIAGKSRRDPICRSALTKDVGDCTAAGSDFTLCTVPASRRERLEHP